MNHFFYVKENSMDANLCKTIIDYYKEKSNISNNNNETHIRFQTNPQLLQIETEIINILKLEVNRYMNLYYNESTLNSSLEIQRKEQHLDPDFPEQINLNLYITEYCFKTITKSSRYDFISDYKTGKQFLTFLFYLNDIPQNDNDNDNDVFLDNASIHSSQGKLIIFPSDWTFPYKYTSSSFIDKYILKGTIFTC